jgi:hypothetical protein
MQSSVTDDGFKREVDTVTEALERQNLLDTLPVWGLTHDPVIVPVGHNPGHSALSEIAGKLAGR